MASFFFFLVILDCSTLHYRIKYSHVVVIYVIYRRKFVAHNLEYTETRLPWQLTTQRVQWKSTLLILISNLSHLKVSPVCVTANCLVITVSFAVKSWFKTVVVRRWLEVKVEEKLTRYGNLVYNRFTTLITNDMDNNNFVKQLVLQLLFQLFSVFPFLN